MAKDTPSMAKNKMKRCFGAILDPHPNRSDLDLLWDYFESTCAYCGLQLERSSRLGHVDHVRPAAGGGSNSVYNHVLACARCNGDEKRETPWDVFLESKVEDKAVRDARRAKIAKWLSRAPETNGLSDQQQADADKIIEAALRSFESSVEQLKKIRSART